MSPGGYERCGHACKETENFIVALSGSFDVVVDDSTHKDASKYNVQVQDDLVCVMSKNLTEFVGNYASKTKLDAVSSRFLCFLLEQLNQMVNEEMITVNIRVCKEKGNAITASYSYLLYGTNDGDCAKKNINRETFMTLSAPQSFLYKVIIDIYKRVEEKKMFEYVERHTPAIMEELGIPMYSLKVVIPTSR